MPPRKTRKELQEERAEKRRAPVVPLPTELPEAFKGPRAGEGGVTVVPPPTISGGVTPPPQKDIVVTQHKGFSELVLPSGERFFIKSPADVKKFLGQQRELEARKVPEGTISAEQLARQEAAAPQLETAGAFEEVTPPSIEEQEAILRPPPKIDFPVLGPVAAGLGAAGPLGPGINPLNFAWKENWIPESGEFFPALTDETLREAALREIRKESFEEGLSLAEKTGSVLEVIPFIKFVGPTAETPNDNAQTVIDHINKIKEAASTGQEKVRNGLEDPDYGLGRAREMEEQVAKLEGRIKLLILSSPILQANNDGINKIAEGLIESKEKISRYRRAASFGLTAQLTGTGAPAPTDVQLFFELKRTHTGQ